MKLQQLFCGIFTLLLLSCVAANAQTRPTGRVAPKPRVVATGAGIKDGLTMQKGRIILTELGVANPLVADKKLINGTIISATGLVTATDGTTTQMNEGDMVSLTGRVTTRQFIAQSDSLAKIKLFDALHPGKRKKAEDAAERKAKLKEKSDERKIKAKEKSKKRK